MFTWYKEFRKLGAVFAEYPTEPGRRFVEAYRENGELFLWVGRLHLIATHAKRLAQNGVNSAIVFSVTWFEGMVTLLPTVKRAAAAAAMVATAATTMEPAISVEAAPVTIQIEETTAWLSSPASDFPEAFVPEATASSSR
jgi:hypothetical protein